MYQVFSINDSLTFEDKNNYNSKLISINLFPTNISVRYNNNEIFIKDHFDYIIIDFLLDNKRFKLIENKNTFKFPLYLKNEIKKYVFINKILKIELNYNDKNLIITHLLMKFIGPNYDFNYSYINKSTNTNTNITIKDYLTILKINFNNDSIIKIYDSFDNIHEYSIDSILKWNPMLIK